MKKIEEIPDILNTITDVVLAYRPPPKRRRSASDLKSKLKKKRNPPHKGGISIWR